MLSLSNVKLTLDMGQTFQNALDKRHEETAGLGNRKAVRCEMSQELLTNDK